MENQIDYTKSVPKNLILKSIRRILFIVIFALIFVSMVTLLDDKVQLKMELKKAEAELFLRKMIDSAINQTDFYKDCCTEERTADFINNIKFMSKHYDIVFIDYDDRQYQYRVFFDEKTSFWAEVIYVKDKPVLFGFLSESPQWTKECLERLKKLSIKEINKPEDEKGPNETN